jgi:predicted membrane-bound spermidine synthase
MASSVLRITLPLDPRLGVLLAATLLFFLPLALLGGVTPFAIRLSRPPQGEVGAVSGLIFAVSTVGSLLAALATGFLLIPNLGVRAILALTGATIMLTAITGFLLAGRRVQAVVSVALLVLALVAWRGAGAAESSGSLRIVERSPSGRDGPRAHAHREWHRAELPVALA